ncbi:MAG: hypothetical protein NTV34_03755, partial [Proteobacteria bacterium]|nr:hypothetical protein [Pseudomonadota bacterium]
PGDRSILSIVSISCNLPVHDARAITRASNQTWLDTVTHFIPNNSGPSLPSVHIERLGNLLAAFAGPTLPFNFFGITIDQKTQTIQIESNIPENMVSVFGPSEMPLIARGTRNSSKLNRFTEWDIGNLRALILAPQSNPKYIEDAALKVSAVPYPKTGAAELTHYALSENGEWSDVIWIELSKAPSILPNPK